MPLGGGYRLSSRVLKFYKKNVTIFKLFFSLLNNMHYSFIYPSMKEIFIYTGFRVIRREIHKHASNALSVDEGRSRQFPNRIALLTSETK